MPAATDEEEEEEEDDEEEEEEEVVVGWLILRNTLWAADSLRAWALELSGHSMQGQGALGEVRALVQNRRQSQPLPSKGSWMLPLLALPQTKQKLLAHLGQLIIWQPSFLIY